MAEKMKCITITCRVDEYFLGDWKTVYGIRRVISMVYVEKRLLSRMRRSR